jgi:hypothetical protein
MSLTVELKAYPETRFVAEAERKIADARRLSEDVATQRYGEERQRSRCDFAASRRQNGVLECNPSDSCIKSKKMEKRTTLSQWLLSSFCKLSDPGAKHF